MRPKRAPRLSLSHRDAMHAYEWLVMYWRYEEHPKSFGHCALCQHLAKRLETFIGAKDAARVRRAVKNNPGRTSFPRASGGRVVNS